MAKDKDAQLNRNQKSQTTNRKPDLQQDQWQTTPLSNVPSTAESGDTTDGQIESNFDQDEHQSRER